MNEISPIERRRVPNDDRRASIAKAARELIVEKGVEGLRTRDIAERVGINVATLHYHVPTKEGLIELVAESLEEQFRDQHVTRPRKHLGVGERMALEFVDFREVALDRPEAMMVFSELMERARRDERIGAAILPLKHKWRQTLVDLLKEGVEDGTFRPDIDAEAAASVILSSMIGFCRNRLKDPQTYERLAAELQRAVRNPNSPTLPAKD
jgi:AcrR family transcriptional regulator